MGAEEEAAGKKRKRPTKKDLVSGAVEEERVVMLTTGVGKIQGAEAAEEDREDGVVEDVGCRLASGSPPRSWLAGGHLRGVQGTPHHSI